MRKLTVYDQKRRALRDSMWPNSDDAIYNRKAETGFVTIPRTLSMICTLIKCLGEKNDPSGVYFELWSRQRDDGFVELIDGDEMAACSGFYRGAAARRVRSFHEALDRLQQLGFICIKSKGPRKYGYVRIEHPHDVVQRMRHERPKEIPDWWWGLFDVRVQEIRAELRWQPPAPPRAKEGFDDFPEAIDNEDDDLPF